MITILIMVLCAPLAVGHSCNLTKKEKAAIGNQIWKNESNQSYKHLVFWKSNEQFPSLGIGHFIWYPANKKDIYCETFPEVLDFIEKNGVSLPDWLKEARHQGAPWRSRADLVQNENDFKIEELRSLLFNTIDLQADYIIQRLVIAWPRIKKHASIKKRNNIQDLFDQLMKSVNGIYILVDYLDFKGEGTSRKERYKGKGWGLLQVLEAMPEKHLTTDQVVDQFITAAINTLEERVRNAPVDKSHEQKWLPGWKNRINTYCTFTI